jgi:hypothetical protein
MAVPLLDWAVGVHDGATLRSVYRTWAPPVGLVAAVDRFWVGEPGWPRGIRLLPDGCVDVVWTGRAVTVFPAGPAARRAVLPPAGRQVGARLRPGAAGALLGVDCAELGSAPLALADLVAGSRRSAARRAERELVQAGTGAAGRAAWRGWSTRCGGAPATSTRWCWPPPSCSPPRAPGWTGSASGWR